MKIPDELIVEIISWLPVKDLVRFSCVSKPWLSFISSDSQFFDLHYSRSDPSNQSLVVVLSKGNRHSNSEEDHKLYNYWFDLDSLDDPNTDLREVHNPFDHNNVPPRRDSYIIASCCGLLVLQHVNTHALALLNPSTGKSHVVPPNPAGDKNVSVSGLGWDSDRHCLKLVTMIRPEADAHVLDLMIYDVNGTWRKIRRQFGDIGSYFRSISFSVGSPGVYVNDALYWHHKHPDDDGGDSILIVGFDLKKEEFFEVNPPDFFSDLVDMVAFGDRLCLVWRKDDFESEDGKERTEIFVMDEEQSEELSPRWVKLISISDPNPRLNRWVKLISISDPNSRLNFDEDEFIRLSPECYSTCRRKVLFNLDVDSEGAMYSTLVWYDLETEEFEYLDNPVNNSCSPDVTTFKRSLVGNGMF